MAMNKKPSFPFRGRMRATIFAAADTDTPKTVAEGGDQGSKVVGIFVSGELIAARVFELLYLTDDGALVMNTVNVPENSGRVPGTPAVDLLDGLREILPKDGDAQPYLYVSAEGSLQVRCQTTITADELVSVFVQDGPFDDEAE